MAGIVSIDELLNKNLDIPDYQRPYKWTIQNIEALLCDIEKAINEFRAYGNGYKYRIGTIILHKDSGKDVLDIVDGQQRIISLLLLKLYFESGFENSIMKKSFSNKETQYNIHNNYQYIREWFSLKKDSVNDFKKAMNDILQVVVIEVENISEAFQLFDSQNNRGKALDPHDLLKAYHLREMKSDQYAMEHAVKKWEDKNTKKIKELFDLYLFPIWNWSLKNKTKPFTSKDIDTYKGISENSLYYYAKRASRAMPYFQITEPFITGNDFFEMVDYYLVMLNDVKMEICNNPKFSQIKMVLCDNIDVESPNDMDKIKHSSIGFDYSKNLFFCAMLFYYDKFHNFDEIAIKKLFTWAFMLRIDMKNLGFDSINKYAIGEANERYTNVIPVFAQICHARLHTEISALQISITSSEKSDGKWKDLYESLLKINGVN